MSGQWILMMVQVEELGSVVWERRGEDPLAAIVLDPNLLTRYRFLDGGNGSRVPLISIDGYKENYSGTEIVIATHYSNLAIEELEKAGVRTYHVASEAFRLEEIHEDPDICHARWPDYIRSLFDREGLDILEVGSRNVTGELYGRTFRHARYTGFDYYAGENVDVVGDAHRLSSYFDRKFDLIFSSAVFEHLAMPWMASLEIIKLLKVGGYVFIETHYSFASHERPWHFFQFSENALNVLFPEHFGIECIKKGCSNLIEGRFSSLADERLRGVPVHDMYCHSEFLGRKIREVDVLSWDSVRLENVVGSTKYPRPGESLAK